MLLLCSPLADWTADAGLQGRAGGNIEGQQETAVWQNPHTDRESWHDAGKVSSAPVWLPGSREELQSGISSWPGSKADPGEGPQCSNSSGSGSWWEGGVLNKMGFGLCGLMVACRSDQIEPLFVSICAHSFTMWWWILRSLVRSCCRKASWKDVTPLYRSIRSLPGLWILMLSGEQKLWWVCALSVIHSVSTVPPGGSPAP